MSRRRRVLIMQPRLQPPGGGQAVAAWMIHALQDTHRLGVVSWLPADFDEVNRWYGTAIRSADVTLHAVPSALRRWLDAVPLRLTLLKHSLLIRFARQVAEDYDVVISAENEADLGRRGIQYIHYPRLLRPRPQADLRWYHPALVLWAYYAACERIMGGSVANLDRNVSLANSTWTAERMRALCPNGDIRVVHPPVRTDFVDIPWHRRENGFLCIGRFAGEKGLERVIGILAHVRASLPDIHLHIIGSRGAPSDYRRLVRLARHHAPWVQIDEDVPREQLAGMIAGHRYGIHGMREEHFGIAPAEMVRAGCIVFVPDGGGQVDIVGRDPRLLYGTPEEAVAKIVRVLTDPGEQASLRSVLAIQAEAFSVAHFVESIRDVVDRLESSPTSSTTWPISPSPS